MQNHSEKRRDMCRSILPSTARKGARDNLAAWKRQHRRGIRQRLADARHYDWLDYEGHVDIDTNRPLSGSGWDRIITHIVSNRQNADKVAPLIRWVESIKPDLPGDDDVSKWYALKALLPDNLIGRHALSHVEHLFDLPESRRYRSPYGPRPGESFEQYRIRLKAERRARWDEEHEEWVTLVRTVVETRHQDLNDAYWGDPCYGLHDIDRWCRTHPMRDHKETVLKIAARDA